jgi:hypothetical protein
VDSDAIDPGQGRLWVPDHPGDHYLTVLARLHAHLKPATYLEIGCDTGASMALARCAALAIDPAPRIRAEGAIGTKPLFALYQMTSDAFFARHDPTTVFGGPIDMAFLDGMHWCEFLLRDFINTERHCRANSVIVLHDCLPVEQPMAERKPTGTSIRNHHIHSWTGDVWRTALLLKRRRPDLQITAYDAGPTGLVCITNLSPSSVTLSADYASCVAEMMSESLDGIGIEALFAQLDVESTAAIGDHETISSRFWL